MPHANVLVGLDPPDDAGVYRLSDELALVQTMDFMTPIVDDPESFGRIAAANALSDVYAMGGTPICAMNIVCFPSKQLGIEVLRAILAGGLAVLNEAEVPLVGGHSVEDPQLKFGLSVTGTVSPKTVWTKGGARVGDALVLTKALGTGIVGTALKRGVASTVAETNAARSMTRLNRRAAHLAKRFSVHACTDVTGFGLVGHACEMMTSSSDIAFRFYAHRLPLLSEATQYCEQKVVPGGLERNRAFRQSQVTFVGELASWAYDLIYDPQTSGGLLFALPRDEAEALVAQIVTDEARDPHASDVAIIGDVIERAGGTAIRVEP